LLPYRWRCHRRHRRQDTLPGPLFSVVELPSVTTPTCKSGHTIVRRSV
jgi:hypothetical protein